MIDSMETFIRDVIARDKRLRDNLDGPVNVERGLPYERQEEYQVWVHEGPTPEMKHSYVTGATQDGTVSGTTVYAILCRVRFIGKKQDVYDKLRALRWNVYRILRDYPSGPTDADHDAAAHWGSARATAASAPSALGSLTGDEFRIQALQWDLGVSVQWEDHFSRGD